MKRFVPQSLIVFAGLLAAPCMIHPAQQASQPEYNNNDPRFVRLQRFFAARKAPAQGLAGDFLAAADHHGLDWRLLPSLSVIESGGGKHCKKNNMFGWDSGEHEFLSFRHGIHFVARRLAQSRIYRGKPLNEKLERYNPNPEYPSRVKLVMRILGPADLAADPAAD
jgi:hypothetical protein